ncbi:MAG TPA: hypothetical protein VIO16_00740 [Dehalococcoidia bacterium]
MIDFTLAELLTGLDMSDEGQWFGMPLPIFVRIDGPLETDASFRERIREIAVTNPHQIATGRGYVLDAIGALHGLVRDGYRIEETEVPTEESKRETP